MISDRFWNALIARMIEIEADDLDDPLQEEGGEEGSKHDARQAGSTVGA